MQIYNATALRGPLPTPFGATRHLDQLKPPRMWAHLKTSWMVQAQRGSQGWYRQQNALLPYPKASGGKRDLWGEDKTEPLPLCVYGSYSLWVATRAVVPAVSIIRTVIAFRRLDLTCTGGAHGTMLS